MGDELDSLFKRFVQPLLHTGLESDQKGSSLHVEK